MSGREALFKEIAKYKALSEEEERDLFIRYKKHDDQGAREKLIKHNLLFVAYVALKFYSCKEVDVLDLFSEGVLGLMTSLDNFDLDYDIRFISYAWYQIWAKIKIYVNKSRHILSIPKGKSKNYTTISLNSNKASEPGFKDDAYMDVLAFSDAPEEVDKFLEDLETDQFIANAFKLLDSRERWIVENYFGINKDGPKTLKTIGIEIGLTRERVRQIKLVSLNKIREKLSTAT